MRRLIAALAIVALALPILAVPVAASTAPTGPTAEQVANADQGTNCSTDPERARFYENAIGDTSDGNDTLIVCGTQTYDLSLVAHISSGICKSNVWKFGDDWEDCISSVHPIIPSGRRLCMYGAVGYSTYTTCIYHSQSNMRTNIPTPLSGDAMSSWRFVDCTPGSGACT